MKLLLANVKLRKIFFVLFLVLICANSLAISYTVQVIALSSETNVSLLEDRLKKLGFPAYTITVPTNQGQIFRLRVGSFANRGAAQKYAEAMQGVLDSSPVAQLAESIPDDLVPLEPKTIASYPIKDTIFSVLPWQDDFIIRIQSLGAFEEASYILDDFSFTAYRVIALNKNKMIRVYARNLWPEVYALDSNTERDAFYQNVMTELSAKLSISIEEIKTYQFVNQEAEPFLVLVEEFDIDAKEATLLKALGKPNSKIDEFGPELMWFDTDSNILFKEENADFTIDNFEATLENKLLETELWKVTSEESFSKLELLATKKEWLIVAGNPVWTRGNFLLTIYDNMFELYQLK